MIRFLPLIWAGLCRKPVRSVLTVLSIAVAFLLLGLLRGFVDGYDTLVEAMENRRLFVGNTTLTSYGLPIAYLDKIADMEGVERVTLFSGMGGHYQNQSQPMGATAINGDAWFQVFPHYLATPETLEAFGRSRTAGIAGRDLMAQYGWRVGDRVPFISSVAQDDGSTTWTFDIVGSWHTEQNWPARFIFFHYEYFDEARKANKGRVNGYYVRVSDPEQIDEVANRIDAVFINSPVPTRSESERQTAVANLERMGDVEFFVNAIVGSAFFTLLFVTGGAMMQSMRERIPEFAVLKSFGYDSATLTGLAVAEALGFFLIGAAAGLTAAYVTLPLVRIEGVVVAIPPSVFGLGLTLAAAMAAATAFLPALHVHRASVVDALAGR